MVSPVLLQVVNKPLHWKHSVTELETPKKHGRRSSRDDTAIVDSIIHGLETIKIYGFHARFDFRKLFDLQVSCRCLQVSFGVLLPRSWELKGPV